MRRLVAALAPLLALLCWTGPAHAVDGFFPDGAPPPTQVTRSFTLKEAAQRGLVKLESKGLGGEGDTVSLTLEHRKVRGPITVTVRVEFTTPARIDPGVREGLGNDLPDIARRSEAWVGTGYRTRGGDPINFKFDYVVREPDDPPRFNYHQVLLLNPAVDLDEPDPLFRAGVDHLSVPNKFGEQINGQYEFLDVNAKTLAHETLHMVGLDDRYNDYYRVRGRDYPLPVRGMPLSKVKDYLQAHRPPLPPPPAGFVVGHATPGSGRCDIMGTGSDLPCRRVSRRDLDWLESQAGVQVTAQPGEVLLNKDASRQNMGVGFRTTVFTEPGSTTTANGVSVYCIDKSRFFPADEGFDVLGPARELPGYAPLAALLELSGRIQPSLEETPPGMLNAVWNVTDAASLEFSGTAEQSRALLAQAGIAEGSVPDAPALPNPNAGSADTGAVTGGEVLPTIRSAATRPAAQVRLAYAHLYPARLRAGRRVRADLLLSSAGQAKRIGLTVQRRAGKRWRKVRKLRALKGRPGQIVAPLALGRLKPGRHRLVVSAAGPFGPPSKVIVSFRVRR